MVRSAVRLLLFMLSFSLEVRVRADMVWEAKEGVLPRIGIAKETLTEVVVPVGSLYLAPQTSVIHEGERQWSLVTGKMLVESKNGQALIKNLFGEIKIENASVILTASASTFEVFTLNGAVSYRPRGADQFYDLPVGYWQKLGRVTSAGFARVQMPQPAEVSRLITLWGSLTLKRDAELLSEKVREYREHWKMAVEKAGPWYKDLVDRQIASLAEEREQQRLRKIELQKEENFLRDMFRRRNFLE